MAIARSGGSGRRLNQFVLMSCVLIVASFTFLSDAVYHDEYRAYGHLWALLLKGQTQAPEQYRIGVFFVANYLSNLAQGHLPIRHMLALMDGLFLTISVWISFTAIAGSDLYNKLSQPARAAVNLAACALACYCLAWLFYYHKAETIANAACISVMGLLLSGRVRWPAPALALSLLLVTTYLATVRADSALALNVGIVAIALIPGNRNLPLGRVTQLATGVVGGLMVLAIEYYISHILFPNRPYPASKFQLLHNLVNPLYVFCVVVAIGPWFFMMRLAVRYWERLEAWECALVAASAVEFVIFMIVAMSNEVRVFLPYPIALLPIWAGLLTRHLFLDTSAEGNDLPGVPVDRLYVNRHGAASGNLV